MRSNRARRIEQRAYEIWEREGRPHGKHDELWHRAEREIATEVRSSGLARSTGFGQSRRSSAPSRKAKPVSDRQSQLKARAKTKGAEQIAILIADVVGSTSLKLETAEKWATIMERFYTIVRRQASKDSCKIVKFMGDSFIAACDSVPSAVRFASNLQALLSRELSDLQLRISVDAGPVVTRKMSYGEDIFGLAVAVAARINGIANANEIVLSDAASE